MNADVDQVGREEIAVNGRISVTLNNAEIAGPVFPASTDSIAFVRLGYTGDICQVKLDLVLVLSLGFTLGTTGSLLFFPLSKRSHLC